MFKLDFEVPKSKFQIDLKDPILLIGSCFSDEIGKKLHESKFDVLINPLGTIYNPVSISKLLINDLDERNTVESQGVFYNWDAHGEVSALSNEGVIENFAQRASDLDTFLNKTGVLIITLGTSFIYRLKETSHVVANCHKIPSQRFTKELLNPQEITEVLESALIRVNEKYPEIQIILTVSPVRHLKDGLVNNNISKAHLLSSVHSLVSRFDKVEYFPSFEIVMDELRDYRFYKQDLIHPSSEAIDYVWEKFRESHLSPKTNDFINEWKTILNALAHRPFQSQSKQHQQFLNDTLKKLRTINEKVDVTNEIQVLESRLI